MAGTFLLQALFMQLDCEKKFSHNASNVTYFV